jgi:hypothetical protein
MISRLALILLAWGAGGCLESHHLSKAEAPLLVELVPSGPIDVTTDGAIVEGLLITAVGVPGIRILAANGVTVRDCEIRHEGAAGIVIFESDGALVESVKVVHSKRPPDGVELPSAQENNIEGYNSTNIRCERVYVEGGSSGFYFSRCPGTTVSMAEGHDFRGPFPRGQFLQFGTGCDNSVLEDFSCENISGVSVGQDNVNVFASSDCTIRRGLIVGNDAPSGIGVIFEQDEARASSGGAVIDVDTVEMMNGSFSAYQGYCIEFIRTRDLDHKCDGPRGPPLSAGRIWVSGLESSTCLHGGRYWPAMPAECVGPLWISSSFRDCSGDATGCRDYALDDFRGDLRAPVRLTFPWEARP